jgi:RHS repeat-associated protein
LKARLLRQEVYALDGSVQAEHPYTVTETTYAIRREQPRADNRHAVFFVHQQESLAYHHERDPADPRLAQTLTLVVDAYGNPTHTATVAYPRRGPGRPPEQQRMWIRFQETDLIHMDQTLDGYRLGLPFESRQYELTGLPLPAAGRFTPAELLGAAATAAEIPYETAPDMQQVQRRLLARSQTHYYDEALTGALSPGQAALHGLSFETCQLIFTTSLLAALFQDRVTETMLLEGGFRQLPEEGPDSWWAPSGRLVFAPDRFFVPLEHRDPFDAVTQITYDAHDLLLLESTDPLQNRITAGERDAQGNIISGNDYRLLQPHTMTDPNGNQLQLAFDVRGLVVATAVSGQADEGDTLDDPTTRFEYDLFNWRDNRQPNFAHTFAREQHGPDNPRFQEMFQYTGGMGQEILTKVQAEPGPAFARDDAGDLLLDAADQPVMAHTDSRWVGNGRVILDNKGNPVRQYEPYFSSTHEYEDEDELRQFGVSPTLHYDPLSRNIRTDFPDGTLARVEFTPWQQTSHDQNDTMLESDWYVARGSPDPAGTEPADPQQRAAWLAAQHAGTPGMAHFDTLSRPFVTIAHNIRDGTDEFIPGRSMLDIEGNPLAVFDGRNCEGLSLPQAANHAGNQVMAYRYAMGGLQLVEESMDGGERLLLVSVLGHPLYQWDSRSHRFRTRYDALQRPVATYLQTGDDPEQLIGLTVYGEQHPQAAAHNLRGQPFQEYDQAEVMASEEIDFQGRLLRARRTFARDYRQTVDWSVLEAFLDEAVLDLDALAAVAAPLLEAESFVTATVYDALNRPTELTTPDDSRTRPMYNEANNLEQLTVQLRGQGEFRAFVDNIDYNEKGQRLAIEYGNGVESTYSYDALTYRLTGMMTSRPAGPSPLQDLAYTYDPVGNLAEIRDEAQPAIFFANQAVAAHGRYFYDPLYRLVAAAGREHIGQATNQVRTHEDAPVENLPNPNNPQAMRNYTERYDYDPAGNMLAMIHQADGGNWTRTCEYAPDSNRLLSHNLPGGHTAAYSYDAHGNMTAMPHLPLMQWDYADQLRVVSSQIVTNGGTPEITYYVYNAAGERVRKVTERQAQAGETPARRRERLYVGGYERFREYGGDGETVILERETLHVMDDTQRIALVETRTQGSDGLPAQSQGFQLGNHLGSAVLELDGVAAVISYEEYHPFGSTAYRAGRSVAEVNQKRYRFTGKERDEESGLQYHGARYYAVWIGRWCSTDPAGISDGINIYLYAHSNPINYSDVNGLRAIRESDSSTHLDPTVDASVLPHTDDMTPQPKPADYHNSADWRRAQEEWAEQNYRTVVEHERPRSQSEQQRSWWSRGGGTLVKGAVLLGLGILGFFSGGATWVLAASAFGVAGGISVTAVGGVQLATSSTRTAQQDANINEAADMTMSLSSPTALAFGTVGAGFGGEEGLKKGALYGGLLEGGASLASGGYNWFRLRGSGPGLSGAIGENVSFEQWKTMTREQRELYELGQTTVSESVWEEIVARGIQDLPVEKGRFLEKQLELGQKVRDWRSFRRTWRTGLTPRGRFILMPLVRGYGTAGMSLTSYWSGYYYHNYADRTPLPVRSPGQRE